MSRILIEATPFEISDLDTDFRHLYLVFQDDQGVETVITAAPDQDGPIDFGNIEVSAGGLLEDSDVARGNDTPGSRGSHVILESEGDAADGRDPADVWAIMLQQAQNIDDASLDYRPLGDNSNTVIKSVLQAVGIDIQDNLPNGVDRDEAVGVANDLDFRTTLIGTAGDDLIVGGDEADVLRGRGGQDRMAGGRGHDMLEGNQASDELLGGPDDDALFGNLGSDRLFGEGGDDTLAGGFGADLIQGGPGDDQLSGGPGADRMRGGAGSDSFDYDSLVDAGDTILDFAIGASGDRLILADLLEDFDPANAADFVNLSEQTGDTVVGINPDGQGADIVPLVTLAGVTDAALDTLIADGNVVVTPPAS
jgi:Ca2+-binding RTX toxin-like protein